VPLLTSLVLPHARTALASRGLATESARDLDAVWIAGVVRTCVSRVRLTLASLSAVGRAITVVNEESNKATPVADAADVALSPGAVQLLRYIANETLQVSAAHTRLLTHMRASLSLNCAICLRTRPHRAIARGLRRVTRCALRAECESEPTVGLRR
jgi:hypothetical protein